MTRKENTWEILRFGTPERVVGDIDPIHWASYFGANHENADGGGHHLPQGSRWQDLWGVTWFRERADAMGFPCGHPLQDLPSSLKTYRWLDTDDERLIGQVYTRAKECDRSTVFLAGAHRDTLWERAYLLCGMEDLMCYFYTEPAAVKELLHHIMDFQLGIAKHYLAVGVEVIGCSDDMGTQVAPLFSPEIMQEFFVPEYRRLFELYQAHGVIITFHSCGHILPLLETFIDLGINVLNPVQASANDLAEVRRITQGRMVLTGGLSSSLLVDGPPESIRAEVRRLLWLLGRDGGYFCAPDQGMPWPQAHIDAYVAALEEFGQYPLQPEE